MAYCLSPVTQKNPGFGKNPRQKTFMITRPCNKCINCVTRKQVDWSFRLYQENLTSYNSKFITWTYAPHAYPGQVIQEDIQRLHHRLRNASARINKPEKKFWYYTASEYGGIGNRAHYHSILGNIPEEIDLLEAWENKGFIYEGDVKPESIAYVCGYLHGKEKYFKGKENLNPEFSLKSRNLGKSYLDLNKEIHQANEEIFTSYQGYKISLPRYYKDRIFTNRSQLERIHSDLQDRADKKYWKDIEKLEKLGWNNDGTEGSAQFQLEWRKFINSGIKKYKKLQVVKF